MNHLKYFMVNYYFLIATRDFLFYQEPIEEILRERFRHYHSIDKEIDFGLIKNLNFLDTPNLFSIKKQVIKPSVAIISLNPKFIDWLGLRIHYAIKGNFKSSNTDLHKTLSLSEQFNVL